MGSEKGQLFMVSIIFLIGMIFIVQQNLFQYTNIEMSEPFQEKDIIILENVAKAINRTISETQYCNATEDNFASRMEELKRILLREYGRYYNIEMAYELDCSEWYSKPGGTAPLKVTISVSGLERDTRGTFDFYHLK